MTAPSMRVTVRLSVCSFGVVAVFATASVWAQVMGLFGAQGIAPIADTLAAMGRAEIPFWRVPTVLWLSSSDLMLHLVCAGAVLCSVCLAAGLAPRWAAVGLSVTWLSLVQVGAPFLSFQWDILLLEASVLMVFLAPAGLRPFVTNAFDEPSRAVRFAFAVLACKVTLGSGLVKLASGDPAWRDFSALAFHWWTQPLPTWTSVIASRWSPSEQMLLCGAMFVLELPIPLLALGPRRARLVACGGILLMQLALFVAGNYAYFNVLTAALALPLLDDQALRRPSDSEGPPPARRSSWALFGAYASLSVIALAARLGAPLTFVTRLVEPLHVVNAYGAFATMTRNRAEIIVEGSDDGARWRPYEFKWKPGSLDRRPDFVAPWQPRLDWQMWFASLGTCDGNPWFLSFQRHLLLGTPQVLALLEEDPFAQEKKPPRYVRSLGWEYRFAPPGSTLWWVRREVGPYCPALGLDASGQLRLAADMAQGVHSP